jgi:hypothetical protein
MQAIKELFSTDIGLLSTFTVAFAIGMIIFLYNFLKKHAEEDAKQARK